MELVPLFIIWYHLWVSALSISMQWETIQFERLQYCSLIYKRKLNKQVYTFWFTWSSDYRKKWDKIVKNQCKLWNSTIVLMAYCIRGTPYHITGLILARDLCTPQSTCCSSPSLVSKVMHQNNLGQNIKKNCIEEVASNISVTLEHLPPLWKTMRFDSKLSNKYI